MIAIAATGAKTNFGDLLKLGWSSLTVLLAETLWIALVPGLGLLLFDLMAGHS